MQIKPKKILKIVGITFLGLFLLLVIATFTIPYFFKDDIQKAVDSAIAKSVAAHVNFDANKFSLSLFTHFPNISITQSDLSIVGKDRFEGDTLLSVKKFSVSMDVWSVVFGSQIKVRGVYLNSPRIFAKVLLDGKANWDIVIPTPEDSLKKLEKEEEKPTEFDVSIRRWQITNALIIYDDKQMDVFTKIENLNHEGSGNFNQKVFDLYTKTSVDKYSLKYAGSEYITDKYLAADMVLNMDIPNSKYTFKRNTLQINDFSFGFDGFVQMLKNDMILDLTYKAKENEFKNILSLVPGMYSDSKEFKSLKTDGKLAFDGFVKGTFNEKQMPAFNFNLKVTDGMFQYPSLPTAISNVQMLLMVNCKDGIVDNTVIQLEKFHMDLGKNPVDAKAKIEKLTNSKIDARALAKINLEDLTKMFPMEGLILRGNYSLDATAKGIYNASQMPTINANMGLLNGFVKSSQFPESLENITLVANAKNASGKYADTKIQVENFQMVMDKEAFTASAFFENLDDIAYNIKGKGTIDLGKMMKIFPIEGTTMTGKIYSDLQTSGRMSYILKSQYDKLPTSGFMNIKNFTYFEKTLLPQGFKITESNATFTPQTIALEKMDGFLGKSDIHAKGKMSNYIGYLFNNQTIGGVMDFNSDRFDADEWMTTTETTTSKNGSTSTSQTTKTVSTNTTNTGTTTTTTTTMAIEVPKNVDFVLKSQIKEVIYGKIKVNDLKGLITIKDGKLSMKDVNFLTMGGSFVMNGLYDASDLKKLKYGFDFGMKDLSIGEAYRAFTTSGADIGKNVQGVFSTFLKINGDLGQDMMPLFNETMNGNFDLTVVKALIKDLPFIKSLNTYTKLGGLEEFDLKTLFVQAQIKEGFVTYKPFDVKMGAYSMNVSGRNGVDGKLDLKLKLDVPTDKINGVAKTALSAWTKQDFADMKNITLNFAVLGTYLKPDIKPIGSDGKVISSVKEAVKDKVKEEVETKKEEVKENIKENASEKAEAILAEARKHADQIRIEAQKNADKLKAQADSLEKKSVMEAAKNGQIAKFAAEKVAKKAKQESYKKIDAMVIEANRKADLVLKEAQEKADKLKE